MEKDDVAPTGGRCGFDGHVTCSSPLQWSRHGASSLSLWHDDQGCSPRHPPPTPSRRRGILTIPNAAPWAAKVSGAPRKRTKTGGFELNNKASSIGTNLGVMIPSCSRTESMRRRVREASHTTLLEAPYVPRSTGLPRQLTRRCSHRL
jgi:hypothetical protein